MDCKKVESCNEAGTGNMRSNLMAMGEERGPCLKRKLQRSEDFIIGRYIAGPQGVDQLVVGVRRRGKLLYRLSQKRICADDKAPPAGS